MINEVISEIELGRVLFMTEQELIEFTNGLLLLESGVDLMSFEPPNDSEILRAWETRANIAQRQLRNYVNSFYSINTEPNLVLLQFDVFDIIIRL